MTERGESFSEKNQEISRGHAGMFVDHYLIPLHQALEGEDISTGDLIEPLFQLFLESRGDQVGKLIQRDDVWFATQERIFRSRGEASGKSAVLESIQTDISEWLDERAMAEDGFVSRNFPVATAFEIDYLESALETINSEIAQNNKIGREEIAQRDEKRSRWMEERGIKNTEEILLYIIEK